MASNPEHPEFPEEFANVLRRKCGLFHDTVFVIEIGIAQAQTNVGSGMFTFPEEDIASQFLEEDEIELSLWGGTSTELIFIEPCLDVNFALKLGRWRTSKDEYNYVIHNAWNTVSSKPQNNLHCLNGRVRLWAFRVGKVLGIAMANVTWEQQEEKGGNAVETPQPGKQENVAKVDAEPEKKGSTGVEPPKLGGQEKVHAEAGQENVVKVHVRTSVEAPNSGGQENVVKVHEEQRNQESTNVEAPKLRGQENVVKVHVEPWKQEESGKQKESTVESPHRERQEDTNDEDPRPRKVCKY